MDVPRFNELGNRFHDAMEQRLLDTGLDFEQRSHAMSLLFTLICHKKPKVTEVELTQEEVAKLKRMDEDNIESSMVLLESIGAIRRTRQGRSNVISFERDGW